MTDAELLEQGQKAQYFLDFLMRCRERALAKRLVREGQEVENEVSPQNEEREADRLPPGQPSI